MTDLLLHFFTTTCCFLLLFLSLSINSTTGLTTKSFVVKFFFKDISNNFSALKCQKASEQLLDPFFRRQLECAVLLFFGFFVLFIFYLFFFLCFFCVCDFFCVYFIYLNIFTFLMRWQLTLKTFYSICCPLVKRSFFVKCTTFFFFKCVIINIAVA